MFEFDHYICTRQPSGSASNGLQLAWYYLWNENWNPDPYKPTFRHVWSVTSMTGQPQVSVFSCLQVARYYFLYESLNPCPYKPTFNHAWRHIGLLPLYLYLASLQYQPPAASRWPDVIFGLQDQPSKASSGL